LGRVRGRSGPGIVPETGYPGRLIKILRKLQTGGQLSLQKPKSLKRSLDGGRYILSRMEARVTMPVFKYFAVVGSALLALLFIFGADESNSRFDGSLYESAMYAPRLEEIAAKKEVHFTRDVTPADRIKEIFSQFVPSEARRGKRFSSIPTFMG
jgi:hypothetical protein